MPAATESLTFADGLSLQCILNAFNEPVFICEKDTRVLIMNQRARKLLEKLAINFHEKEIHLATCLPVNEIKFKNLVNLCLSQSGVIPSKIEMREPGTEQAKRYTIHCSNIRSSDTVPPKHLLIRLSTQRSSLEFRFRDLKNHTSKLSLQLRQKHQLASIDLLTNMANRRHFSIVAEQILKESQNQDQPCCLLMLDLDYFKQINDKHGHDVGDEVLRQVGQTLNKISRTEDIAARWGGEEFVLLITNATKQIALNLGQRINQRIGGLPLTASGESFSITVSIGISQADKNDSLQSLLKRSDDALYEAKLAGRNRSIFK
ncbi:MAG: GGDEF domain-containing protein [Aestuariibacter sp.]